MWRILKVIVEFPALDRLMNYLEGSQQQQIDMLTEQLVKQAAGNEQSRAGLERAIQNQQKETT